MQLVLHRMSLDADGVRTGTFTEIPETPEELAAAQAAYTAIRATELL